MNTIPKGAPRRTGNRFRRAELSPVSIVAYHEAGHAVISVLAFREMARSSAPVPVTSVEINAEDILQGKWGRLGVCNTPLDDLTWPALEWSIVADFAGGLAEMIHRGERNRCSALRQALMYGGTVEDLEAIKRTIAALRILTQDKDHDDDDEAYRHFAGRAWDLLKANWGAVEAIAQALMERHKLDGAEVEALLNAHLSATGRTPAIQTED